MLLSDRSVTHVRLARPTVHLIILALAALLVPTAARASCTTSGNVTTCTSSSGISVNTTLYDTAGSSISVSGLPGTVTAISVTLTNLNFSGSSGGGLNGMAMALVPPTGTALDMLSGVCNSNETTITLDDSTTANGTDNNDGLIPGIGFGSNCPSALSGTYRATDYFPEEDTFSSPGPSTYYSAGIDNSNASDYGSGTSDFTLAFGLPASASSMDGTWTLYIANEVGSPYPSSGSLGSWSIAFTTEAAAATTTSLTANPNGQTSNVYTTANGGPATSVALTATVTSSGSPVSGGTVTFYDSTGSSAGSGTALGSPVSVSDGEAQANVTFSSSQEGLRNISAVYNGVSGTYAPSTSGEPTVLTVNHPSNPSNDTYCNGPITINSNSSAAQDGTGGYPYPSQIILSGISGTIENLTVELNGLQAEDPNFMGFMLQAPSGNALELMSWTDGNGPGGDPPALTSSSTDVYLDDTGSGLLQGSQETDNTEVCPSGSPCRPADDYTEIGPLYTDAFPSAGSPFSSPTNLGKAYPTGTATLTSQFGGGTANGTWLLYLDNWLSESTSNNGSLPYGQLTQWCLSFTMQQGADATATSVIGTPNPATITSGTTASVTLTANVTDVSNSGTLVNAGSVTFVDGSTTLGSSPVSSSGQATISASLNEGTHQIVASYSGTDSGSPEFGISTGKIDVRVNKATSLPTSGSRAGPYTYCNAGSITAPGLGLDYGAAAPYPSNIFVTGLPGTVNAVTVTLDGFSTKDQGDLMSLLVGPGGNNLDFFSLTGTNVSQAPSPLNIVFSDTASNIIADNSSGNLTSSGSFKPTSYNTSIAYPQCPPNATDCGSENVGPPLASSPFTPTNKAATAGTSNLGNANAAGVFGGTNSSTYNGNGTWSLYVDDGGPTGDGEITNFSGWCVNLTVNLPSISFSGPTSSSFPQGGTGSLPAVTITNEGINGAGSIGDPTQTAANAMTVTDTLPTGLTYSSSTGADWSCSATGQTVTCRNQDTVGFNSDFSPLTINVNVSNTASGPIGNNAVSVSDAEASNTPAAQTASVTIEVPPSITSAASTTFGTGVAGSFTVTTNGNPAPALSETGALPSGVTFIDNGNGTATLAGTPALGSAGNYPFTIAASNGIAPDAMQSFTLTVNPPPTYVVTTNADDATGTPSDCPIPSTGNTCTLRDALAAAASAGSGNIIFDPTAFATAQTITLSNGTLEIRSDTSIAGATSGSGASLTNLVTVSGNNISTVLTVSSGVTGASIANLIITNGNGGSGNGGGINNGGALTVSGSSITGSQAANGGGIYDRGSLTITGSTISGNQAQDGAGIANAGGTLNVSDSTISGNISSQYAGGIADNGTTTLINSTVSGNQVAQSGGGIASQTGTTGLANSIVSGNTGASSAADDIDSASGNGYTNNSGDVVGVVNGNTVNGRAIILAPLANYGGSTQTMLPLPGSAAICAGVSSSVPSGVTTDQRGEPIAGGGYCPSGNVDSGSVQTNYAISFTTQPPATTPQNVALSPAPVVSLTESGAAFTAANSGTVSMSDSATLLGGTTTATLTGGAATFSNLTLTGATSNDMLTATLPLNGPIDVTTTAATGVTALLTQTITFAAIAAQPIFSTYTLTASSDSGLPITYYTSTPSLCTISGGTVTLNAIGYCNVFATQPGNNVYGPAAWVGRNIEVVKAAQTITFPAMTAQPVNTTYTLPATASSGLPITYTTSTTSICTITGEAAKLNAPGYCSIYAAQPGNADYSAATSVARNLEVLGTPQTINFPAISPQQAQTTVTLTASASSGLPVTFASTTPTLCTVNGNMASLLAPGYCGIEATQAGNSTYAPATAGRNILIEKAPQTITFPAMPAQPVNTTYTLPATASSGLPITYTTSTPTICTIVNGNQAQLLAVGYCGVYAAQPGNSVYAAATTVGRNLQVVK